MAPFKKRIQLAAMAREQRKKLKRLALAEHSHAASSTNNVALKMEPDESASSPEPAESTPNCTFCLRSLSGTSVNDGPALRRKIEFVLAEKMQLGETPCCSSCSQMFDLFSNFKKSCLLALSMKEELLQVLAGKTVEQKCEVEELEQGKVEGVFKCSVCSETFEDEDEHGYHINQHFGVKPFPCQVAGCKKAFPSPEECSTHEALCSISPPKECDVCGECFVAEAQLVAHKAVHNEPQFACPRCKETFFYDADCENHVLNCQFVEEDPLTNIKVEIASEEIEEQMVDIKLDSSESPEQTPEVPKLKPVDESPLERCCRHCGQSISLLNRAFFNHQRKCKPDKKKREPFKCVECDKTFGKRVDLEAHINRHNGVKPYPCRKPGCEKTFYGYTGRFSHEQYCKTERHVCDICGTSVSTASSLRTHRSKHEEPKIQCDKCEKRFTTKQSLVKHQGVHSEERKFECKVCGKKFKSAEANRVHQRIHTDDKPYACPDCGERFRYNCSLKAHQDKKACFQYLNLAL